MAKPIVPTPTDTHESSRGVAATFGPRDVQTPQGVVQVEDGPGFQTLIVRSDNPAHQPTVGFLVYDPDPAKCDGVGWGLLAQMEPDIARSIAASLLRLADQLKPLRPH